METINLTQLMNKSITSDESLEPDTFMRWALITLISEDEGDITRYFPDRKESEDAICNVEVKINGVEVKFSDLLKRLAEGYNKSVESSALNYIPSRVLESIESLNSVVDDFKEKIQSEAANFILNMKHLEKIQETPEKK